MSTSPERDMRKLSFLATLSLGLAFTLSAQQRVAVSASGQPAMARPAPAAPSSATGHVAPAHAPASAHVVHPGSNAVPAHPHPGVSRKTTLAAQTVPSGLGGFVNSVTGATATCNKHGALPGLNACPPTGGGLVPFYGGDYYIPVPYYVDSTPQEQAQTQDEVEQSASNGPPDSGTEQIDQERRVTASQRPIANNLNDSLAEFVFVQRDGSKLYAVAYSFMSNKLQYVTKEGVRHSVALDSLDLDATQKSNEKLGNTISLPNLPASGVALSISPAALQ